MRYKKTGIVLFFILCLLALFIYNSCQHRDIIIQEAKIVSGVDKNLNPLKETTLFSKNTSKACCWLKWRDAKINTQVLTKWYYVTDDLPIYDYVLNIPKREGVANVVLAMPEGKTLPPGIYKVDILCGKKRLAKTLNFEIE